MKFYAKQIKQTQRSAYTLKYMNYSEIKEHNRNEK